MSVGAGASGFLEPLRLGRDPPLLLRDLLRFTLQFPRFAAPRVRRTAAHLLFQPPQLLGGALATLLCAIGVVATHFVGGRAHLLGGVAHPGIAGARLRPRLLLTGLPALLLPALLLPALLLSALLLAALLLAALLLLRHLPRQLLGLFTELLLLARQLLELTLAFLR